MIKRISVIILCVLLTFSLCSCNGDVSNVKIKNIKSDIFKNDEINSAVNVVINNFKENWNGCELKDICYVGDDSIDDDLTEQYGKGKVIVLQTSFYVGRFADVGIEPDTTVSDYKWILIRDDMENWKHVNDGR